MNNSGILVRAAKLVCALGAVALATGCSAALDEGEDTASTSQGIIGGTNAAVGGHPWIVRLFNNTDPSNSGSCAGALITADWVVTAAHCVGGGSGPHGEAAPYSIFMYLGDYDTSGFGAPSEGGNYEQGKFASEVHIPSNFGADSPHVHDIALVKLETPAFFNSRVKPIALSHATLPINSGTAIAAGWGSTAPQNPVDPNTFSSNILQRVSMPIRSTATCNGAEVGLIRHLSSDELCAGTPGTAATCGGDSGGPLIRAAGSGYELIGVTSWGAIYCGSYSVFSRVSSALSWIRTYVPGA